MKYKVLINANLPCSPGWIQSITSLSASTALTGITPPPKAFPSIWKRKLKSCYTCCITLEQSIRLLTQFKQKGLPSIRKSNEDTVQIAACSLQLAICISHLSNLASMTRYSDMTYLFHHARHIRNTVQRGKNFLRQGKQRIQMLG